MTMQRTKMPTGKKLEAMQKRHAEQGKRKIAYHSVSHCLLLYAKFKKKAFAWDDWNNFHADNYKMRRHSGESFLQLLICGYVYHRVINNVDYFQITPLGEQKLIHIAEARQKRDFDKISKANKLAYQKGIGQVKVAKISK